MSVERIKGWLKRNPQGGAEPIHPDDLRALLYALSTTPARAEAQDEGTAGDRADTAFKIASDLHAAYEQLIYGLPKYLEAENLTDEENMIQEAYVTLDVTAHRLAALSDAHPSPTPARAEAQDEGTAGYLVALLASYCGDDTSGCTDETPCLDCVRMANVYKIPKTALGEFVGELGNIVAPSPTPAADADRVRIAVEALERYAEQGYVGAQAALDKIGAPK